MSKDHLLRKSRIYVALVFICLIFFLLFGRLYYIQVVHHEEYTEMAIQSRSRNIDLPAKRGSILDRNGKELALSVKKIDVWASVRDMDPEKLSDDLAAIEAILGLDPLEITQELDAGRSNFKVAHDITKEQEAALKEAGVRWLSYFNTYSRTYPNDNFAAQLIGPVDSNENGLSGMEIAYNDLLKGVNGRHFVETDIKGRMLAFGSSKEFQPQDGRTIVLTIDEVLQHYLETALAEGLENFGGIEASGILMDVKTGEILAIASKPDYNLNQPFVVPGYENGFGDLSNKEINDLYNQMWSNPVIQDASELGSVFKLVTAAIGLEENKVTPQTKFNETDGIILVDDVPISCWRSYDPHGLQTLTEALENSCNPVFVEVEQMIGRDTFYRYLEDFGLFTKTGIDFPAEANPIYQSKDIVRNVELATMSYGHGISVSQLQLIRAVAAIANNGKLVEPHLVKEIRDEEGNVIETFEPKVLRQVISEQTSAEMRLMMESVVENGSGRAARLEGVRVGGKTGTAEIPTSTGYDEDRALASFAAVAPIEDPQVALFILVREPETSSFGSEVAAPIAGVFLKEALRYLNITSEEMVARNMVKVPNVMGLSLEEAMALLDKQGLTYSVDEEADLSQPVKEQFPVAGKTVLEGALVILK